MNGALSTSFRGSVIWLCLCLGRRVVPWLSSTPAQVYAYIFEVHSITVPHMYCAHVVQVRVIFLSQLLHDGKAHLQQHLTASVLGRKVFVVPFHRGIQVTPQALGAMKASLIYCQKVRLLASNHE